MVMVMVRDMTCGTWPQEGRIVDRGIGLMDLPLYRRPAVELLHRDFEVFQFLSLIPSFIEWGQVPGTWCPLKGAIHTVSA